MAVLSTGWPTGTRYFFFGACFPAELPLQSPPSGGIGIGGRGMHGGGGDDDVAHCGPHAFDAAPSALPPLREPVPVQQRVRDRVMPQPWAGGNAGGSGHAPSARPAAASLGEGRAVALLDML